MRNTKIIFFCIIFVLFFTSAGILIRREYSAETIGKSNFLYENTVIIDAGHGGEDGGAVGIGGILEKDINLGISEKLNDILGLYGVNSKMTRSQDISLHSDGSEKQKKRKLSDAQNRVKQISETPGAILISIHQNSFPQESCHGAQVFFGKNNILSKSLAKNVLLSLNTGLDNGNSREIKKAEDRIYLIKNVNCPAILVECGFLTNKSEAELLMTDAYRLKISACIASGYLKYANENMTEDSI